MVERQAEHSPAPVEQMAKLLLRRSAAVVRARRAAQQLAVLHSRVEARWRAVPLQAAAAEESTVSAA